MSARSRFFILAITFVGGIGASGCATKLSPFTLRIRQSYNLSDSDIRNLQYYVSDTITLQRALSKGEVGIKGHALRVINNSRVEEVKINPDTPGIAESSDSDTIYVSFEENCNLGFESKGGYYRLLVRETVIYCGREYSAVDRSGAAHLLIDLSKLNSYAKSSRTVKGRKLPQ